MASLGSPGGSSLFNAGAAVTNLAIANVRKRRRRSEAELNRARATTLTLLASHGGQGTVPEIHAELLERGLAEDSRTGHEGTRHLLRSLAKDGKVSDLGGGLYRLTKVGAAAVEGAIPALASGSE